MRVSTRLSFFLEVGTVTLAPEDPAEADPTDIAILEPYPGDS